MPVSTVIPPGVLNQPGRTIRRRGRIIRTSHPSQHADQPTPDPEVPGYMLAPKWVRGVEVDHEPHTRTVGIAPLIGGPEPPHPGWLFRPICVRGYQTPRRNRARTTQVAQVMIEFVHRYWAARGLFRVFAPACYRLYRSNVGPPEEGSVPWTTCTSLPHTPADTFADGTWYVAMSYYNGLIDSGFLPLTSDGKTYRTIVISSGVAAAEPPAGPLRWRLETRPGGVIRVVALYAQTGSMRADQWSLGYTVDGSPPAESTPTATQTMAANGLALLTYDLPAQSHGTTVKVRLQTRRNDGTDAVPVWVYSTGSVIETATADAEGPSPTSDLKSYSGILDIGLGD